MLSSPCFLFSRASLARNNATQVNLALLDEPAYFLEAADLVTIVLPHTNATVAEVRSRGVGPACVACGGGGVELFCVGVDYQPM